MQENLKIFETIPYEVRIIKGSYLSVEQAEEALNDVLSDTSAFFKIPSRSEIIKVKSDNVYGVYKLLVTLAQGSSFPEYMLNARVEALAPKLVNVIFEAGELEEELNPTPIEESEPVQSSQTPSPSGPNIIVMTSTKLGLTYKELSELIGYTTEDVVQALSSGVVSPAMKRAIELYNENLQLKKELEASNKIKSTLKEWLK